MCTLVRPGYLLCRFLEAYLDALGDRDHIARQHVRAEPDAIRCRVLILQQAAPWRSTTEGLLAVLAAHVRFAKTRIQRPNTKMYLEAEPIDAPQLQWATVDTNELAICNQGTYLFSAELKHMRQRLHMTALHRGAAHSGWQLFV